MEHLPAHRTTIEELVKQRDAALARMSEAALFIQWGQEIAEDSREIAKRAHGGAQWWLTRPQDESAYKRLFANFDAEKSIEAYRRWLDGRCWQNIFQVVGLNKIMDRTAIEEHEEALSSDVPSFTFESVVATIEERMAERVTIFRRGLARTFADLDRRFRSHDAFKFKHRIIFTNMYDKWGSFTYMRDSTTAAITDVERIFMVLDSRNEMPGQTVQALRELGHGRYAPFADTVDTNYFHAKVYKNGNVHLWFTRKDLLDRVNQELAAWYGDTLGDDSVKEGVSPADLKGTTALSTKLQFYATPPKVAKKVIYRIEIKMGWRKDVRVLEPSAGEGALCLAALSAGVAHIEAVEVHPSRCDALDRIANQYPQMRVTRANFLDLPPRAEFDVVLMNPPFHRTHYMQHVTRAMDWLKPGGILVAVLPASVEFLESKKHEAFRQWISDHNGDDWGWGFGDLPEESFAESGTRVNTCTLMVRKPR